MGQHTAFEIGSDLALDEAGDGRSLRSRSGEEGDELRADDLVQERLLGLVADVVCDGEASAGTASTGRGETLSGYRMTEWGEPCSPAYSSRFSSK